MSGDNPTLKDIWRLLGTMNKRFDGLERQVVELRQDMASLKTEIRSELSASQLKTQGSIGALKDAIEARDFRLDDHGRRLTELESSRP